MKGEGEGVVWGSLSYRERIREAVELGLFSVGERNREF